MDKRIVIGLSALVAALGGFLAYQKWGKKKPAEETADNSSKDSSSLETSKTIGDPPITENKALIKTMSQVLKPKPRKAGFVEPPKQPATFVPKAGAKKTTGFSMGAKLYSLDAKGTNTYSKPEAVSAAISKHYKKDEFIGTYLGQEGKGSMIKVIVTSFDPKALFTPVSNDVRYIPVGQVYTK